MLTVYTVYTVLMRWISTHPYTSAIIGSILLISVGVFVVRARSPVSGQHNNDTWGGFGAVVGNTLPDTQQETAVRSVGEARETSIPQLSYGQGGSAGVSDDALSALKALAEAASTSNVSIQTTEDITIESLYKLLPHGISAATTTTIRRSQREQALFNYGNTVGAPIEIYGGTHQNQGYIIADFIAERTNQAKQDAVARIANDLTIVGNQIATTENVPSDLRAMHDTLSQSYMRMGEQLTTFSKARTDEELLAASLSYNTRVEEFNKAFLALATLFEIAEVQFGIGDPGHVFMFGGS